ncbi:hypothetical protein [Streptomyces coelicoflavus]|uniref:hypothetical protein n=1 Tax=Streptomyces coelicoflavus TaxID=285562 RepID=UPI00363DE0C6
MRVPIGRRGRETDSVSARGRLLRRVLTVTGLAGAFAGAGLIAASAAQAEDQPAHAGHSSHASARPNTDEPRSEGGLLSGVGKSVGALLGAEKQAKPASGQSSAHEPKDAAGSAADRETNAARAKRPVPRADTEPSPRRSADHHQEQPATRAHKGSAPAGEQGPLGRVAAPVSERVGEVAEPVTAGLGSSAEPVASTVGQTVGRAAAPATESVARVLAPVTRTLAPVTDRLAPITAPLARSVAPVTDVLGPVTAPLLRPVTAELAPLTEPVTSGTGLSPVTSPVGLSPAPSTPGPGSGDSVPATGPPTPPDGQASATGEDHTASAAHPDEERTYGPTAPAAPAADSVVQHQPSHGVAGSEAADGRTPSGDYGFPASGHGLPAGTTGATSSSSSVAGGAGPVGVPADPAAARSVVLPGGPASTAWDVNVSGLIYDGRGPRVPG